MTTPFFSPRNYNPCLVFPNKQFCIVLPNPRSNPLNIGKYFVITKNYGVHLGHGKNFCRKKIRVRCKKNRVPADPNIIFSPQPYFFLDEQFCSVLSRVHWTRIRLYEVVKFLITRNFRLYSLSEILLQLRILNYSPIIKKFQILHESNSLKRKVKQQI